MYSSDVSKCEVIEVAFEAANKHEVPANQDKNLKDRICDKSFPSEKQDLLFLDLPTQNHFSPLFATFRHLKKTIHFQRQAIGNLYNRTENTAIFVCHSNGKFLHPNQGRSQPVGWKAQAYTFVFCLPDFSW